MFSHTFLLTLLLASCVVDGADVGDRKSPAGGSKPNIVFILADDLGIGDIGCYGNTTLATPHIDSLAQDGVKLTQFLTAAAVCTPSRTAFLTGRYPVRSGLAGTKRNIVSVYTASPTGLPQSEVSFAELLKDAGYTNALIGKWHLGLNRYWSGDNIHNPLQQGFDYWFGIPLTNLRDFDDGEKGVLLLTFPKYHLYTNIGILIGVLSASYLWRKRIVGPWLCFFITVLLVVVTRVPIFLSNNMKLWNSMLYRNNDLVEQPMRYEGLTERLVAEGVEFLEARQQEKAPFMLFMSLIQVHTALHAGPKFRGASSYGAYGDEVMEMDWSVGEILKALDRLGLRDDTLVIFTSDHGGHVEELGKHGDRQGGHNGIYRGGKFQGGMDGGIRVPALVRWPSQVSPQTQIDVPLSGMDILPTLAEAAGVPLPGDRIIDGVSLLPLVTGEMKKVQGRDYLIHYCSEWIHAVRFNPDTDGAVWKVRFATPNWNPGTEGCGFVCFCDKVYNTFHEIPLVFDMTSDPRESHPLASEDPRAVGLVQKARDAIQQHVKSIKEVEQQLTWSNTYFLWPWMTPCCNFPSCSCNDTKSYNYKT